MKTRLKELLDGYEYTSDLDGAVSSKKSFLCRNVSGAMTVRTKKMISARAVRWARALSDILSYTHSRVYGALLLAFGIFTMLLHFAGDYFINSVNISTAHLVAGAVIAILGLPFLMLEGPVCIAMQNHFVTDYIFFEFFCLKRMPRDKGVRGMNMLFGIMIGVMLAVAAFFLSVRAVALGVLGLVFLYLSFIAPEFPLLAGVIVMPILPLAPYSSIILSVIIGVGFLSFLRKVIFGKRVLHIEQYDVIFVMIMLCIAVSGAFSGSFTSFLPSLYTVLATLVYFLVGNLIANRRTADCMASSLIISSVVPSIYGIVEFFMLASRVGFIRALSLGVDSSMASREAFAILLVVSLAFTFAYATEKRKKAEKAICAITILINAAALVFSGSFIAPLALASGIAVLAIYKYRRVAFLIIALVIALPYILFLFYDAPVISKLVALLAGRGAQEHILLLRESAAMALDNIILGVGIGQANAANLFLGLSLSAGAAALVLFLILMLVRMRHISVYTRYMKKSEVGKLAKASFVAMVSLIAFGLTDFLFSDLSVYFIFISVFAVGSATLRISKRNYDDRHFYYKDSRANDSADIDVDLR